MPFRNPPLCRGADQGPASCDCEPGFYLILIGVFSFGLKLRFCHCRSLRLFRAHCIFSHAFSIAIPLLARSISCVCLIRNISMVVAKGRLVCIAATQMKISRQRIANREAALTVTNFQDGTWVAFWRGRYCSLCKGLLWCGFFSGRTAG